MTTTKTKADRDGEHWVRRCTICDCGGELWGIQALCLACGAVDLLTRARAVMATQIEPGNALAPSVIEDIDAFTDWVEQQ